MFTTEISGLPYRVSFKHKPPVRPMDPAIRRMSNAEFHPNGVPGDTTCHIHIGEPSSPEAFSVFGVAYCHPKDNPCKAKGRKLALRRALEQTDLLRSQRALVWDAYFELSV